MELYANNLMFEMTRKCTMMCSHCLRGEQEELTLNMDNARKILNQVSGIGSVIFTGGEPFLEPDKIIEIIDIIMDKQIPCNGFYIATNGSVFSRKLMDKLCEFVPYCQPSSSMFDDEDILYQTCVDISKTPYHDTSLQTNDMLFSMYRFVKLRKDCTNENYLIPEGRAYINGYGQLRRGPRDDKSVLRTFDIESDDEYTTVEMIYVNCNGKCFYDCNLSYNTQADLIIDSNKTIPDLNRDTNILTQIENYNKVVENMES